MAGVEGWWSGPGGGWLTTWYDMIFSLMVVTRVLLMFPSLEEMYATPGPLVMMIVLRFDPWSSKRL